MWLTAHASVEGSSHAAHNLPCQDAHLCKLIKDTDALLCVVSDGAGSSPLSHLGAGIVVEAAYKHFSRLLKEKGWHNSHTPPASAAWHEVAKQAFRGVRQTIEAAAKEARVAPQAMAATAIVAIATPHYLLCSHICDCRAGYRTTGGVWKSMIQPYKGEYANETIFITSPIWEGNAPDQYIESRVIDEPVDAVVLMSDGCENVCYETTIFNPEKGAYQNKNTPFAGFLDPMIDALHRMYAQGMDTSSINRFLEEYLAQDPVFAEETDDKTLILIAKK